MVQHSGEVLADLSIGRAVCGRPLPVWQRTWYQAAVRRFVSVALFGDIWQGHATRPDNPPMFPHSGRCHSCLLDRHESRDFPDQNRQFHANAPSGSGLAAVPAAMLSGLAMMLRLRNDLSFTLTAMATRFPLFDHRTPYRPQMGHLAVLR